MRLVSGAVRTATMSMRATQDAHCAGNGEEAFIPHIDPNNSKYDYDSLPTGGNEDGDWRTVYMDDERYDDREEDEMYDDDRDENGW